MDTQHCHDMGRYFNATNRLSQTVDGLTGKSLRQRQEVHGNTDGSQQGSKGCQFLPTADSDLMCGTNCTAYQTTD